MTETLDDDMTNVRLLYSDVQPYIGQMRSVIQAARQGEIIHKGFRMRDSFENNPQPVRLAEKFYAQLVKDTTNLRMWAEHYSALELQSLSYTDFAFIRTTLLNHYKTSNNVDMANDFAKHDNPEQKVLLGEGIFTIQSFYENFLMDVINAAYEQQSRRGNE